MSTYKRIEAVFKTGEILKYLAHQKEPIGPSDIAQATGMPKPTVMCHLVTLEEVGFVQSISDRWKLGTGLALIYARVKSSLEAERAKIDSTLNELGGNNGKA